MALSQSNSTCLSLATFRNEYFSALYATARATARIVRVAARRQLGAGLALGLGNELFQQHEVALAGGHRSLAQQHEAVMDRVRGSRSQQFESGLELPVIQFLVFAQHHQVEIGGGGHLVQGVGDVAQHVERGLVAAGDHQHRVARRQLEALQVEHQPAMLVLEQLAGGPQLVPRSAGDAPASGSPTRSRNGRSARRRHRTGRACRAPRSRPRAEMRPPSPGRRSPDVPAAGSPPAPARGPAPGAGWSPRRSPTVAGSRGGGRRRRGPATRSGGPRR